MKSQYIRKNSFFKEGKIHILSSTFWEGRYFLDYDIKKLNKINYSKLNNFRSSKINSVRNFIRKQIFKNTAYIEDENRELILSILLGERLSKSLNFINHLGINHYFVISGFHINLLEQISKTIFIAPIPFLIILIYFLIIFTPSSLRAFLFMFFKMLAKYLGEERSKKKEFLISLFVCLVIFGYDNISLQLSFIASSIFIIYPNINSIMFCFRIYMYSIIPCLYFFGKFNMLSILPNIILAIPIKILIYLSFLTTIIYIPNYILNIYIELLKNIMRFLSYISVKYIHLKLDFKILIIFYIYVVYKLISSSEK
jgi:hypothetical protein